MDNLLQNANLMLILDLGILPENTCPSFIIQELGKYVDVVQLRAKNFTDRQIHAKAEAIIPIVAEKNLPFIINDRVEIALEVGEIMEKCLWVPEEIRGEENCNAKKYWGCHLGQDDMPIEQARTFLGDDAIIGASVHNIQEAKAAKKAGANYLGYGSIFGTKTKNDAEKRSIDEAKKIKEQIELPLFLIGGINLKNIDIIMENGFSKVASASGIINTKDPLETAEKLKKKLNDE